MAFPAPPRLRASASVLALALICVPLTIGAIWAFPIWDDAWFWLLLKENGTGAITTTWVDRPVMATVWSLLATTEPAFWRASFVAQALLWPTLGIISALLWTILFPHLRQYAMVVGCITVAPIISKVQMVTANIALATFAERCPQLRRFSLVTPFRDGRRPFWVGGARFEPADARLWDTRHGIRTASCHCYGDLLLVVCTACTRSRNQSSSLARHLLLNP